MIGIVTDSTAQVPPELIERYGLEVVPITVTVDGVAHLEGVDLDADTFWAHCGSDTAPKTFTTAAPSPGQLAAAYEALVARGAEAILSVHIGSQLSGTLNAARVAATTVDVPVRLVDTGTASFAIGCCVWEAADAAAAGASLEEAAATAEQVAAVVENVFVVGGLELARAGGRLQEPAAAATGSVPVLTLQRGGTMQVIGQAGDPEEAADLMAARVRDGAAEGTLRVGLAVADPASAPLWRALEARLLDAPQVKELVRYRVGPSVGAHTGPGTTGAFYYPTL